MYCVLFFPTSGKTYPFPLRMLDEALQFFRNFVKDSFYTGPDSLLQAAVDGRGQAADFCLFVMQLRNNEGSRRTRTLTTLRSDYNKVGNRWVGPLKMQMWSLYACLRILVTPDHPAPYDDVLSNVTKEQRHALSGTGLVRPRKENRKKVAALMRSQIDATVHLKDVVIWLDNFNKKRFSRNPNENRDKCINGTVFAILTLPFLNILPRPYPSLKNVLLAVNTTIILLPEAHKFLCNFIRDVLKERLTFEKVRAPLDIRRKQVRSKPWLPAHLDAYNVGSNDGLLQALAYIRGKYIGSVRSVSILADVNIYYRVVRLLYSATYAKWDFRSWLGPIHMILGVWHSYKYCVQQFYSRFLPLITCLEYGTLYTSNPTTASIANSPKLVLMERVILGVFLNSNEYAAKLKSEVQRLKRERDTAFTDIGKTNADIRLRRMEALKNLVLEYVPMLFAIGRAARDCYWEDMGTVTGLVAKDVHLHCLLMLLQLRRSQRGRQEYIGALTWQLILWSGFTSCLPSPAHNEEALESMLSRLSRSMRADLTATSVQEVSEIFVCLGVVSQDAKDIDDAGISRQWPSRMKLRLDALIKSINDDTVPYISYTPNKQKTISGQLEWPASFKFPPSLFEEITLEEFDVTVVSSITTTVEGDAGATVSDDRIKELCPDLQLCTRELTQEKEKLGQYLRGIQEQRMATQPKPKRRGKNPDPNAARAELERQLQARARPVHPSRLRLQRPPMANEEAENVVDVEDDASSAADSDFDNDVDHNSDGDNWDSSEEEEQDHVPAPHEKDIYIDVDAVSDAPPPQQQPEILVEMPEFDLEDEV